MLIAPISAQHEFMAGIITSTEHGGSFFSKCPEQIFTPEDFSADELLMIQTAEQFSRKEILPRLELIDQQQEGLMPKLLAEAGAIGFCGIDTPEEYGGLGLSKNLAARILEYLSLNASFSVSIGVTSGISQVGLTMFGSEEQRQKYLPKLASGEWIGAYALSEPDSGSDALSLSTKAELRDGHWVLNGTKMWISNAKWANLFLVMAKVDGERITAFLVERDSPGVSIGREEHKMGLKGSSTARLVLENAVVPPENMLYLEGKGHQVALNSLNLGRFKLASMSIGPAREAIAQAAAYAVDRKQFGKSISEFGLVRKKFAEMASRFYAAESMIYRTGALIDGAFEQLSGPIEGNKAAAEEFAIECSACKIFATEVESFIVDEALQIFGGYGFTEEFPVARIFRDARVSRIYEGTNEINRVFLGDRLRRRAAEGRLSLVAAGDSYISELAGKVFAVDRSDQVFLGALSDIALLTYAEQSARLRATQRGGIFQLGYENFVNWANMLAAETYRIATGEGIDLPAPLPYHVDELALAVLQKHAPLSL